MLGKNTRKVVKFFHLLVLCVITRQLEHRLTALFFRHIAQEQSALMIVLHVRCKGRRRASAQRKVQIKITNDFLREQTDEIRVARETRVIIGK